MDVYDCIRYRLTVRRFKPDPVPEEVVARLLDAARLAPSSRNLQQWHFVVITDREALKTIADVSTTGKFIADAPLAIAVVMDNADTPDLDAGRALQQMELLAWSEGLGTCFVGLPLAHQQQQIKALLGIPTGMDLITVLPFGYRPEGVTGRFKSKRRKPLSGIAHGGRFGERYEGSETG